MPVISAHYNYKNIEMNHNFQPRFSHQTPVIQHMMSMGLNTDPNRMLVSSRKLENINCIIEPSQKLGGLYLGDVVSTMKQSLIRNHQIRAILTCMSENIAITSVVASHKILPIKDILQYPIINHFDEAIKWIADQRQAKLNVLVHCHAGVSRSATIVIAYLMRINGWNPVQTFQFVKQKRERIKPNVSFWNQINDYYNYWSGQTQSRINQKPLMQSTLLPNFVNVKENIGFNLHPNKNASQQILHKTYLIAQQNQKQEKPIERRQQRESIALKVLEKDDKKQKFSVTRRKRIFDRNQLLYSCIDSKIQNKPVISQYYNRKQNQNEINNRENSFMANDSFMQSKSCFKEDNFMENKSSIQLRTNSRLGEETKRIQHQSINSPHLQYGLQRPTLLTPGNEIIQQKIHYLSPFEVRSYISP